MQNIYHYTECGLDDVYIYNMPEMKDDDGDICFHIPHILQLHAAIATDLINKQHSLSGKEVRFLRSELGLTQTQLAKYVQKDQQAIEFWEQDKTLIEPNADFVIRSLMLEKLKLN